MERPPTTLRGKIYLGANSGIENHPLPTDALGTMTLTMTNLIVGSAIRIEVQSTGVLVELRTAASTTEVFTLSYYGAGSANNDTRIKVRKASAAPLYKPYETIAILSGAAQSIYIAQIPD